MKHVQTLTFDELVHTQGGFLPLLVVGACLLLASCGNKQSNNNYPNSQSVNINSSGTVATDSAHVEHNSIHVKLR